MDIASKGAMEIFWRRGYLATNLPDLLQAMGLTRGSFYKAFGDKEAAYLVALDRYDTLVVDKTVEMLTRCEGADAADCLGLLFSGSADPTRGCLICNAMVELGPFNSKVSEKANMMAARLRNAIHSVLRRFRPHWNDHRVSEMADVVLHLYFGHQAMGKARHAQSDWVSRLESLLETA